MSSVDRTLKRLFDFSVSGIALIILIPILLLISVLIKWDSDGPVLFKQERLGKDGKPFTMYKFRTMQQNAPICRNSDGTYFVGANDPRLTRIGRLLRESSLDELPQLFNVLKNDMSLVGPRPDPVPALEIYNDLLRRKLEVKPGIASLASLYGRNCVSLEERAKWEAYYVDQQSLKLDFEILLKTAVLVLLRKGVYSPESSSDKLPN
ncbi:MAG: sugar transferase [Oscillatoria sp. Prado101]|jgi:lipopolysaccharide/colanic/teichoic acid biosynthesis glycosyltransferase|nr:sugar transferase [Oscillatoria sp. Prado101]